MLDKSPLDQISSASDQGFSPNRTFTLGIFTLDTDDPPKADLPGLFPSP